MGSLRRKSDCVPTEGPSPAVLDKHQLKAIERAAIDAGRDAWRHCRLAMVDGDEIVGYPAFSRADMAELARLYREGGQQREVSAQDALTVLRAYVAGADRGRVSRKVDAAARAVIARASILKARTAAEADAVGEAGE